MTNVFKNMKIGTKIYSGFGIALVILLAVVTLSYSGLQSIRSGFEHYTGYVEDDAVIAELVTSVGDVQTSTLLWLRNQNEENMKHVKDNQEVTRQKLKLSYELISNPERVKVLDSIGKDIDQFSAGISKVEMLAEQRAVLVKSLIDEGTNVRKLLEKVQLEALSEGSYKVSALAGIANQDLMLGRVHASKFLRNSEKSAVVEFEEDVAAFNKHIRDLTSEMISGKNMAYAKEAHSTFDKYKDSFSKATEVILERNEIINKDLVDVASAIVQKAYDLKSGIAVEKEEVSEAFVETQKSITLNALIMGAVGVVLSVLASFMITRQITGPINAMRNSLMKLSEGDVQEQIPYTENGDEIGEMARALRDFREDAVQGILAYNALNTSASCVMMSDLDLNINYMNDSQLNMLRAAEKDIKAELSNFDTNDLMGKNIDIFHKNPQHQRSLLGNLQGNYSTQIKVGPRTFDLSANAVFSKNGDKIGYSIEWQDRTNELLISDEINDMIEAASQGDLDNRISLEGKDGFFREVSEGVNNLAVVMQNVAKDLAANLQALSQGDLTARITSDYEGIFKQLKDDYNTTSERLEDIVGSIKEVSGEVSESSDEMADSSAGLSNRAEQQASTLEETAASMEELTSTVRTNADNARDANKAANDTRTVAERGTQVANDAGRAMEKINESSRKITDIINVIDEIAFQTNLLALNAAVEAARAGDAGRGFAVVAQEVRTLAQRSAQSSKDIKALIDDSSKQVGEGVDLVKTAVESLQEIYDSIEGVTDLVGQIASASAEQATSLDELNQAVMEMDSMTQQNAAMAQQSKITAEGMQRKSLDLQDMVAFFKLANEKSIARVKSAARNMNSGAKTNVTQMASVQKPKAQSTNGVDKAAPRAMAVGEQSMDNDSDWQEF